MRSRVGAAVGTAAYVGALVAVGFDAAASAVGHRPPGTIWTAVLLAAGLATVAGAVAGAVAVERFEPLRRDRVAATLGVTPLVGLVVALVLWVLTGRTSFGAGAIGTIVALVGLSVLRRSAQHHHARRHGGSERRLAALPRRANRASDRRIRTINVGIGALWLVLGAGAYLEGGGWWVLSLAMGIGFLGVGLVGAPRLSIVESGVYVESHVADRLLEWTDFDGYYLGDELVLLRSEWWHSDLRFDADEVDDAALAALDDHLVRSKTRTVPASGVVPFGDDEAEVAG